MCGIAGFLSKDASGDALGVLTPMLDALRRRGPDSTGMALYSEPGDIEVGIFASGCRAGFEARLREVLTAHDAAEHGWRHEGDYLRLTIVVADDSPDALSDLADAIEAIDDGLRVFAMGHQLHLLKGVADASELAELAGRDGHRYTHGIGHARMATESRVDVAHAHPFWARPFPDIALVHNGHITNYYKLRRIFEQRGYRFQTENDSEFMAVYLADQLHRGATLEDAVRSSIDELDGCFTYLISSPDGIAVARDKFASKPCVVAESDSWVAIASEELALHAALPADYGVNTYEVPAGETRTWSWVTA
jgi:glutamate synthase domain-containing protein 1